MCHVVFYFRIHGNYLINSFAAYLLCEKKEERGLTAAAGRQSRAETVNSKPHRRRHIEKEKESW